jgi:2-polyprenyl-3-methyl-5-hydroxy-6-metoxy-1,4-benzoquinol methylase
MEQPHGEADLVASYAPATVLDAGCGTGRVAIELARRGIATVGVDLDETMLGGARRKAQDLAWVRGDLATVALHRRFDVAVMAGNVMIFLAPGTEGAVVANVVHHVRPGGVVVTGFQLQPRRYRLAAFDADMAAAGATLIERWATWERAPFRRGDYAVSVHLTSAAPTAGSGAG